MHINTKALDIIWPTSFLYRKVMSCNNLYYPHFLCLAASDWKNMARIPLYGSFVQSLIYDTTQSNFKNIHASILNIVDEIKKQQLVILYNKTYIQIILYIVKCAYVIHMRRFKILPHSIITLLWFQTFVCRKVGYGNVKKSSHLNPKLNKNSQTSPLPLWGLSCFCFIKYGHITATLRQSRMLLVHHKLIS